MSKLQIVGQSLTDADGAKLFILADTWWYGLTHRASEEVFSRMLAYRRNQGFNALQLVIGPPPELSLFHPDSASTHEHQPFQKDLTVNQAYVDDISRKIQLVCDAGLIPILYGSWGNYIDTLGPKPLCDLWDAVLDHFVGHRLILSVCGEADIFPIQHISKPSLLRRILQKIYKKISGNLRPVLFQKRLHAWDTVARHLHDTYGKKYPITIHIHSAALASEVFTDPQWLQIDSFQSGHSIDGLKQIPRFFQKAHSLSRPYLNLEPMYEGIMGQTDIRFQLFSFWSSVAKCACGHVYGAHGIWQMAQDDDFMAHWGKSDFETALHYPGAEAISAALAFMKAHLRKYALDAIDQPAINFTFSKEPLLLPILGEDDGRTFTYIPDLKAVQKIISPHNRIKVFDCRNYQQIGEYTQTIPLEELSNEYDDLFLLIDTV